MKNTSFNSHPGLRQPAQVMYAAACLASLSCAAWAVQPVTVQMTADKLSSEIKSGEAIWTSVERPGTSVTPGDTLRYSIVGTNHLTHAIRGFALTEPIPHGTVYVAGTAKTVGKSGAVITASVDGGQTYAEKPMIEVKGTDGRTHLEAAPAARYTHVRWTFSGDFAPDSSVSAQCEVRVR